MELSNNIMFSVKTSGYSPRVAVKTFLPLRIYKYMVIDPLFSTTKKSFPAASVNLELDSNPTTSDVYVKETMDATRKKKELLNEKSGDFSLLNLANMEEATLPRIESPPSDCCTCILSSSPSDPDCHIFFVAKNSIVFFRKGADGEFVKHESIGEVVTDVEVYRADFTEMAWVKLDDIGERTIFISPSRGMSYSVAEAMSKANCVYFTLPHDKNLYFFYFDDRSILESLPCPSLDRPKFFEWVRA
ncbi:hypothetical protein RJ639_007712 [Escallonia herrerae]|uniref:KIB1-4 beta-propeller domain-containing protein n=1 Tax=Escallonia herrerae TaxID=1293975 RepID=A0AA88VYX6_9ASTE|nr:hypothetical protein RJ639_007712 [Escallonia herrerae]